ncbi:MAG: MFS transporter [Solimonas sp.]
MLNTGVGLASCTAQILVPLAASMADDAHRGKAVGTVISGRLLGILLARTVSGLIADLAGWRAVYVCATLVSLLAWKLPGDHDRGPLQYGTLMQSVLHLAAEQPVLRQRALCGTLGFGAFGLIGVAGALAASAAGRFADQ